MGISVVAGPTLASLMATYPSLSLMNNPDGSGPFSGTADVSGRRERATYKIDWAHKESFMHDIAGYPSGTGVSYTWHLPMPSPWTPNLYAMAISYEGKGANASVSTSAPWPWVLVTVEYATPSYDVSGASPSVSIRYSLGTNMITVPGYNYAFSNGNKIETDVGISVAQIGIEATFFQVPDPGSFMTAILPYAGTVNSVSVTIDGCTYAAGCLFFAGNLGDKTTDSLGNRTGQMTLAFTYRSLPWNSGIRDDGTVDVITPAPFATTDFNGII